MPHCLFIFCYFTIFDPELKYHIYLSSQNKKSTYEKHMGTNTRLTRLRVKFVTIKVKVTI